VANEIPSPRVFAEAKMAVARMKVAILEKKLMHFDA
jgi:hypothetical protein